MIAPLLLVIAVAGSAASTASIDPVPQCLRALQSTSRGRRIAAATWRAYTPELTLDPRVLVQLDAQPEFTLPVWDYVAVMADGERIADGQRQLALQRALLDAIQQSTGVDAATLVAIWGIESNFGRGSGSLSVLRSLATLSCAGRRQQYFRGEFLAALRIVQAGHVQPTRFLGSWAGAFGQTQFMPGSFERLAVDQDGDGKKDVVDNAGDALASTANYLRRAGWKANQPWGIEVRLPHWPNAPFSMAGEGRRTRRSLPTWTLRGVTRVDGSALISAPDDSTTTAGLITPTGPDGPAFLVMTNFDAVFRYNASESYTLAVSHLADRIRGASAFVTPWPTTDLGLSRAERRELQLLLARRGYPIGPPNGMLTAETRAAVKAEQQRLGVAVSGRPGQRLLALLRSGGS